MRVVFAAVLVLLGAHHVNALTFCETKKQVNCFTGQFGLDDIPGDKKYKTLASNFGYVDPAGVGWQTNKGDRTNGASIPALLQPFVGTPWRDEYIRAAVIHDRYCDRDNFHNVRPWRQTHRVFYDAMMASGMEKPKAKLMYYAVYAFGPKWGWPKPGTECSGTENCIQTIAGESVMVFKSDRYEDVSLSAELKTVEELILAAEAKGGLSLEDLERAADAAHPQQELLDKKPLPAGAAVE